MNDVFKILTKEEWSDALKHGYIKTDIDKNDGFIHFSTSKQLAKTLRLYFDCLLYTSPSPRDGLLSRMPSSA